MPLMPSPGSPKITSTPQSEIVSSSVTAAVFAMFCFLRERFVQVVQPLHSVQSLRFVQSFRLCRRGRFRSRACGNDLNGLNGAWRLNGLNVFSLAPRFASVCFVRFGCAACGFPKAH